MLGMGCEPTRCRVSVTRPTLGRTELGDHQQVKEDVNNQCTVTSAYLLKDFFIRKYHLKIYP